MTYNKLVNGEVIPMTPEEIAERQAEEQAYLAGKPMREWQAKIAATDSKVTARLIEDALDGIQSALSASGISLSNHLPDTVLNVMSERKTIRNQKPKG